MYTFIYTLVLTHEHDNNKIATSTTRRDKQMQLTTLEQLAKVEVNQTLFLINPFGNGNQSEVSINAFTVSKVNKETFDGRSQFLTMDIDMEDYEYFTTILGRCKYVYTELHEANVKLDEIHKGLHQKEVKKHHDSCRDGFMHYLY